MPVHHRQGTVKICENFESEKSAILWLLLQYHFLAIVLKAANHAARRSAPGGKRLRGPHNYAENESGNEGDY